MSLYSGAIRQHMEANIALGSDDDSKLSYTIDDAAAVSLQFITDVDFGSQPMRYCMRLQYDDIGVERRLRSSFRLVRIRLSGDVDADGVGVSRPLTDNDEQADRRHHRIPGRSFNLGRPNCVRCRWLMDQIDDRDYN